jgi:ParB-like chromosome segregation protein Spo0J
MEIINKKVCEIIAYANNPRKNNNAVDKVAASIKEFGFKVPIIIDKTNTIVAGHTRLLAAKKLHLKEVPCIMADDLNEDQINAFRLADNKTSEYSEWDIEKLEKELETIDLDMSEFGFDDSDYGKIEETVIEPKEIEIKPYTKVHYLISLDINDNDKVIPLIDQLKQIEGVTVDSTLN